LAELRDKPASEGVAADPLNFKSVTITFHSMKSASATIGALGLSEEARKLEAASRQENDSYVMENILKCFKILSGVFSNVDNYIKSAA
jgi:HPt (histidine-containing phosphotransfer) domain-containing protein